MRWAGALAIVVPAALATLCLLGKLAGNQDLARSCLRGLRIVIAAEFLLLLLFAALGLRYERRARLREEALFHAPGKLVDIGGYRLHLYCTGRSGPTVILEHGHRATYLDWHGVQPAIAQFTRVCSYDRAGYGWSEPSPRDRTPSVMAEELHSALQAAGEKPPYIVAGHSFGAINAEMFAHKFPDEVAAVVLVDGSTPESLPRASLRTRLWMRMMQLTMPFGLPRWRGWCGGGPSEISGIKQALTCRSRYFGTILRENAALPQTSSEVRAIRSLGSIPLIVIARDQTTGRNADVEMKHIQQQRELTRLSTNSRFVVAEGSGHDVPLAKPDVIVQAVKSLFRPQAQADSRGTP